MEAHPFQGDVIRSSAQSLQRHLERYSEDPWGYIGAARAFLIVGYRSGDRLDGDNFDGTAVQKASRLVERAIELDGDICRAYALQARIEILEGEYRSAWKTLNRAHELDKRNFYPWYLMGVLNQIYQDYESSEKMLRRARQAANHTYQKRWVLQARKNIAEATDDAVTEEALHHDLVELYPQRAHAHGNYGAFLLEQERYAEAVEQFDKALAIQSYPLAERQREKALRRMRQSDQ